MMPLTIISVVLGAAGVLLMAGRARLAARGYGATVLSIVTVLSLLYIHIAA